MVCMWESIDSCCHFTWHVLAGCKAASKSFTFCWRSIPSLFYRGVVMGEQRCSLLSTPLGSTNKLSWPKGSWPTSRTGQSSFFIESFEPIIKLPNCQAHLGICAGWPLATDWRDISSIQPEGRVKRCWSKVTCTHYWLLKYDEVRAGWVERGQLVVMFGPVEGSDTICRNCIRSYFSDAIEVNMHLTLHN